jgi:hypothetical protein
MKDGFICFREVWFQESFFGRISFPENRKYVIIKKNTWLISDIRYDNTSATDSVPTVYKEENVTGLTAVKN